MPEVAQWKPDPLAIRERLSPAPTDFEYLALSDLREFIGRFATADRVRVLDFGAGNSPYRSLFPNADYFRADVIPGDALDFLIGENSALPAHAGEFDLILSTQVAEHLRDPLAYFREAHRVLKSKGAFVVTTHGIWEEHGSPHDFQRWTALGLERDLRQAGFVSIELYKITAGDRAGLFLTFKWLRCLRSDRSWLARKLTGRVRALAAFIQGPLNRWCDRSMSHLRIVGPALENSSAHYIIVAAVARKSPGG